MLHVDKPSQLLPQHNLDAKQKVFECLSAAEARNCLVSILSPVGMDVEGDSPLLVKELASSSFLREVLP